MQNLRPEGNADLAVGRRPQTPTPAFHVSFSSHDEAMRSLVKIPSFLLGVALVLLFSLDLLCVQWVLHDSFSFKYAPIPSSY